jgi:multicomponent Na+:H+ antiporter subunit F
MEKFFAVYLIGVILLMMPLVVILLRKEGFYNHFAAILAISTFISIMLMLVGFVDGRVAMYMDISLSFTILSFVSSVIVAKFMSGRGGKRNDD